MKEFKKPTRFERYLTKEINIEFKACLYFYCFLFFYCFLMLMQGTYQVSILILAEMIFSNYIICYIQLYLFRDFDEADSIGMIEIAGMIVCTGIYVSLSYWLNWFGRELDITCYFAIFIIFCYICIFLIYKIKRRIDTKELNTMLNEYKSRNGEENGRDY